ncbi:MAG: response regulator, partial [Nitrospira sp.]
MTQRATTILAVDDDPVNLEIIQESLADLDYRIVTAADGEQAWALLQEDPDRFDAVLLDRMMPKMNGMALLA